MLLLELKPYKSVWYDSEERCTMIATRERDGTPRDIDDLNRVYRAYCKFRRDSSALHDWKGTATSGLTCTKCNSWCNTWHNAPERGCNNSRSLTLLENV